MVWANCRRMVVPYGIVAEITGPSLQNSRSGIPDPEFWSKLILPWNDLIPTCVPRNSKNSAKYPKFRKMRTGINWNTKRNAHPRVAGGGRWDTMTTTMIVVCISLEELFARNSNALDAFGGRDGEAVRVVLADYLTRRLRTSILTRVRGNVAIMAMSVGRPCHCRGGGRGRGGEDNAGGGGLGPMTPFVLKKTNCRVSSLLLGVGQMPTLEVILHTSSVIASSSKSAAPMTAPVDNGVQSVATSAAREERRGQSNGYGGTTQIPFVRRFR